MTNDIELIDLNEEASNLTNEQISAIFKVKKLRTYLNDSVDYEMQVPGVSLQDARKDAICCNLQVYVDDDNTLMLEDLDCDWAYAWDVSKKTWIKK